MDFTTLLDLELNHSTYGTVKVIDVHVDPTNVFDAKIVGELQDNLQVKKFYIRTLDKFFNNLPDDVMHVVKEINAATPLPTKTPVVLDTQSHKLRWHDTDENETPITIEKWERSKKFITSFQYFNTKQIFDIPIVVDNSKVYINVLSACADLDISKNKTKSIYAMCNGTETKSKFEGHKWRYATNKDINYVINQIRGS